VDAGGAGGGGGPAHCRGGPVRRFLRVPEPPAGAAIFAKRPALYALARDADLAGAAAASAPAYDFEIQFWSDAADDDASIAAAIRGAARHPDLVHDVSRVERYVHGNGRTSHAFRVVVGSKRRALTREQADEVREAVEANIAIEIREGRSGRRVSAPRPWPT